METLNFQALAASFIIFGLLILISNVSLASIVFGRKRDITRRSFLMLNFVLSDVALGLSTLLHGMLFLIPPPVHLHGLAMAFAERFFLPTVANVNVVAVNLSYVLEARRTYRKWNDSLVVAVALVLCPWLYALLIFAALAAPDGSWSFVLRGSSTDILLMQALFPGLLSVLAAALAVWAYTSRGDKRAPEGLQTGSSEAAGTAPGQHYPSSFSPPGTQEQAQPPKPEVAYTTVSVLLLLLSTYLLAGATQDGNLSYTADQTMRLSAGFLSLLRPALFPWLWNLRKENVCCRRYQPLSYTHI